MFWRQSRVIHLNTSLDREETHETRRASRASPDARGVSQTRHTSQTEHRQGKYIYTGKCKESFMLKRNETRTCDVDDFVRR